MAQKVKGRAGAVADRIHNFCKGHPAIRYEIHVTRWERDALGVVRQYAMKTDELLRIHVMGGSGTLFEAVNGVIGLPNVQLAVYPFGRANTFLRYFGLHKSHLFMSIRNQVFSETIPIDALRCGHHYCIANALVGLEAAANEAGRAMLENNAFIPDDFAYVWSALKIVFGGGAKQEYRIELDGKTLDGRYFTMMIANTPCYGKGMAPGVDAHPNDGAFDLYLVKEFARIRALSTMQKYLSGHYRKIPGRVSHYRGARLSISSDSPLRVCADGQVFRENAIDFEIMPYAIDFVCPGGVDVEKLPRIYGRPDAAVREGER